MSQASTHKFRGILCGIIAAVCYGTNPLGVLPLYAEGLNACSVLSYRFIFATLMLGLLMTVQRKSLAVTTKELAILAPLGVLMSSSSITLYLSFHYMDAGIASTLLFVYPVMGGGVMMNKYFSRDNKSRHQRYTSDVFEMATAITNQSSTNCVCLYPNNLDELPAWELEWLRQVPTEWDDVRYIDGYPTRYAVIARRCGDRWYVGGLNATDKPLTLTLSLPMLAGQTVDYLTDLPKKADEKFYTSVKKQLKVNKKGEARVTIQPNGGIVLQ